MKKPRFFGKSIKGRRSNNEDSFLASEVKDNLLVMAIADGMGGAEGGEIASSLVIKEVSEYFNKADGIKADKFKDHLNLVFERAQNILTVKSSEEPELRGLGTTLTCLLFKGNKFAWGNIGDSRLYRIRNNKCILLTKDHTYQNELEESGTAFLQEDFSHVLTKVIDGGNDCPDLFPSEKDFLISNSNDLFVLCSDGAILSKMNKDHKWLLDMAINSHSPEELTNEIIQFAYDAGSSDNITVIVLNKGFYSGGLKKIFRKRKSSGKGHHISGILKSVILLLIAVAFASGWVIGRYTDLPEWNDTNKYIRKQTKKEGKVKDTEVTNQTVSHEDYREFEKEKASRLSKMKPENSVQNTVIKPNEGAKQNHEVDEKTQNRTEDVNPQLSVPDTNKIEHTN